MCEWWWNYLAEYCLAILVSNRIKMEEEESKVNLNIKNKMYKSFG